MKVCTLIVASALSVSAALASQARFRGAPSVINAQTHRALASDDFPASLKAKAVPSGDAYHMQPVRVVHARVEASAPVWDDAHGMFVSSVGSTFDEQFRAGFDTVNTLSLEGALMYVQTEGINYATRDDADKCTRTNGMKYVVLYDVVIAQTNETLAAYGDSSEYGPYLELNDGQCAPNGTDANGNPVFPGECDSLDGTNGAPALGPFVGARQRSADTSAPYGNVWQYSFPNTCPLEKWGEKTDACRANSKVPGLCPYDTKPDGVTCTFNYRVLGWVPLDDLVGITQLKAPDSDTPFTDFAAFCAAGGVEFNVTPDGEWVDGLDFWKDPSSADANTARVSKLVAAYMNALSNDGALTQVSAEDRTHFRQLPSDSDLTEANPPCYKTIKSCATAEFGCRRDASNQMCSTCEANDAGCVVAPGDFTYPKLDAAEPTPTTEETVTPEPTTATPEPTTTEPETVEPTTAEPETLEPTTAPPKSSEPTTDEPKTPEPTTQDPKTPEPTTPEPTTPEPTTPEPTTPEPTTPEPTTSEPTTSEPTTTEPATPEPTTDATEPEPTTVAPTDNATPEPSTDAPEPVPTTEDPTTDIIFAPAEVPTTTTATPEAPTSVPTAAATTTPASNTTTSKSEKESTATQRITVTTVALAVSFVASCLLA